MNNQAKVKKLFIRGITFMVFAAILYCFFLMAFGLLVPKRLAKNLRYRLSPGHMLTRLAEAKKTSNIDVLFLGSSHSYRSFDPRIMNRAGYTTFNLGSSAQTPLQTKVLVEKYITSLNPKLVVYEVYQTTFCLDGIESTLDILSTENIDETIMPLAFSKNIKILNTLIFAKLAAGLDLAGPAEPITIGPDTYIPGGYVQRTDSAKHFNNKDVSKSVRTEQFNAFKDIVAILNKRNIKLFLVQAPIPKYTYAKHQSRTSFETQISQYGPYTNFNDLVLLNDSTDFYDSHHLNQSGVDKFNRIFLPYLEKYFRQGSIPK